MSVDSIIDLSDEDGNEWVEVRASSVLPGELGVFAKKYIPAGKVIGKYKGIKMTLEQFQTRYEDKGIWNGYGFYTGHHVIDAGPTGNMGNWACRINAATNTGKVKNVAITSNANVKAVKNITAGTELLTAYGKQYWAAYNRMHS